MTHAPVSAAGRVAPRQYLHTGIPPDKVTWQSKREAQLSLFGTSIAAAPQNRSAAPQNHSAAPQNHSTAQLRLPRDFVRAAPWVAAHTDPQRWDILYRLLWRLTHQEPKLMHIAIDPDVARFTQMLQAVRRDVHKMHAFVRFRKPAGGGQFVAWYRPDHTIFRLATPHFARRYPNMPWSIHSQHESAQWDTHQLTFGPGCDRRDVLDKDTMEDLWGVYYASIFNPARLKLKAMRQEMPVRYWSVMPETRLISKLIGESGARLTKFYQEQPKSAKAYFPQDSTHWPALQKAAQACTACDFCHRATQTVFGEGNLQASIVVVGEQPGDEEDKRGVPFVGPAGKLLQRALTDAQIARDTLYVTNAVKHFKWTPRGKKRIHQRPLARDIAACRPWLAQELAVVRPRVVVCLGATAAQSVLGRAVALSDVRSQWWRTQACEHTLVTAHPAYVLRLDQPGEQAAAYEHLVRDLCMAKNMAHDGVANLG